MKYTGGCHCGNVRFEIDTEIKNLLTCNCSICSKKGVSMAFAPESSFKLIKGDNSLKDYLFNKHVIHHLFCTNCGIHSFGKAKGPDGTPMVAINARCLDNFDLKSVPSSEYDGKSK